MVLRIVLVLAVSSALIFQNCSDDASFTQSNNSFLEGDRAGADVVLNEELGNGEDEDFGVINRNCNTQTPHSKVIKIEFPDPGKTCNWEHSSNLSPRDEYFQARIEQSQGLDLPVGAVICGASFDFPNQRYRYDDYFALLFNRNLITSGYDFEGYLESKYFGLLDYKWSNIRGIPMNFGSSRETIYCPQIPGAQADCQFPGHDTSGRIQLSYDDAFIQSVMATGIPSQHSFTLVTFGDNNARDCEHSDIEFTVTVDYVLTQ